MFMRVLSLAKDGQLYVFRYMPGHETDIVDVIMRLANRPGSELDFVDAARLTLQVAQHLTVAATQ